MSEQQTTGEKAGRKKLRVGQVFKMDQTGLGSDKPKSQLKRSSQPYQQKVEKEKQALAEDYWGGSPAQPKKPETQPQIPIAMGDPYFAANPHMNLHNLNKFGTLMDEITFDEEEFKNDPEKYLQSLPEECLHEFEDMYHNAHIAEIINDLDEETENKFEEKMKGCSCCNGFVYKCKGKICYNLGICQCMARNEMEKEAAEHFITECADCPCCRGYVYTCLGDKCQDKKSCICFDSE